MRTFFGPVWVRMPKINNILIANRGEIALRIMRTCKELGRVTVAVFSEADRSAAHVRYADQAYPIGPAPAADSYLNAERILQVARKSGADAIHPGYGFLSEQASFAELCHQQGITFIGPSADSIRIMGDKIAARKLMQGHGVPVVPGTPDAIGSLAEARDAARAIGYPVLAKAAAGGGGKGMRKVDTEKDLSQFISLAQSEAQSAFGDGRIFIEKYLEEPRHIEFQVLADVHGHQVHLFERECSIQRRHQKIIEEAPACLMTPELREAMGQAALRAAAACGYAGAGTVEFLVDSHRNFYFMEMNTRLQVEHPITEWITGLDLVAQQIRVAEGQSLAIAQDGISIRGHAVECRIYAEDAASGFVPDPGYMSLHLPPVGVGVRVDSAYWGPGEVPIHYDPMIAKVTTWGQDRAQATRRMIRALKDYRIAGVKTTLPYCLAVMESDAWQSGQLTTHFVRDHPNLMQLQRPARSAAAMAALYSRKDNARSQPEPPGSDRWLTRRQY
ncbi:MAG: acetyl-CoA carboxylase biotin carboxylase subunit [Bacteroidota bacterium]|nr:acetyl-CoA carboxylase biotin carboxylase subunit [Bacteroidota bacterium]